MKKTVTKKKREYNLTISFNDQVFNIETDNLFESITEIIPFRLKTRVIVLIKKGDLSCERLLLLEAGRRTFRTPLALQIFINRLIFK
jgi:hypothetical protein